jgi:hypothetical protein
LTASSDKPERASDGPLPVLHRGGCLCGAIRFEIEGELAPIQICHCSQCRRGSGSAFATNIPVSASHLKLTSGGDRLKGVKLTPEKTRWFCGDCGSPIYSSRMSDPATLRIRAGTLDGPMTARPAFHFYTASKADWWDITDDLPQHPGERPGGVKPQ